MHRWNLETRGPQGAAALAHKLPPNLLEKAFSRSLDLINPLRELERTPSQVLLTTANDFALSFV